ncbi:MAG: ABC transporter permease subunit [Candidatus Moduliflexus flocculans]|nr:ABC transporter permease subunit [Candidatus Moduliflexus flocculans]
MSSPDLLNWVDAFGLEPAPPPTSDPVLALVGYSLALRLPAHALLDARGACGRTTSAPPGRTVSPVSKIIYKHALKNALDSRRHPTSDRWSPRILTGSFVIEKVFTIPGIGKYFVQSVSDRDYTMIIGTTVFYAVLYVVMVLLVDVAYSLIDPRIRLGKKSE